ncbi:zinc finger protein 37A-like [Uranotaenia lowii]|uniref:zinc finger protein 37A-like n=1 Tax=Uranotaenia lowii TaxID=190385 RepID=UPI00247A36A8|nr:zinc finger protein 37A-like [Uranotaenia lowii]
MTIRDNMPCFVPTCDTKDDHGQTREWPLNSVLAKRWLQAVQAGCQLGSVSWRSDLASNALEICDAHFEVTNLTQHYLEPSRFRDKDGVTFSIESCKICLEFYRAEDVLDFDVFMILRTNVLPQNVVGKLISSCPQISSLICVECAAKLEMIESVANFFDRCNESMALLYQNVNEIEHELVEKLNHTDGHSLVSTIELVKSEPIISMGMDLEDVGGNRHIEAKCMICKEEFSSEMEVIKHLKNQHDDKSRYSCKKCDRNFYKIIPFHRHLISNVGRNSEEGCLPMRKTLRSKHTCDNCGETFSNVKKFTVHRKACKQSNSNKQLHHDKKSSEKDTKKQALYKSLICRKKHEYGQELTSHIRSSHVDQMYPHMSCGECQRLFSCEIQCHIQRNSHLETNAGETNRTSAASVKRRSNRHKF